MTHGSLPKYKDLPVDPSKPPGSSWGLFGEDDELGTINLLTPERVASALHFARKGSVFSLNWDVEKPGPPILGRQPLEHHIIDLKPGADDFYNNFFPQASSQWDALCHMPHPNYGYYNGRTQADITGQPGSRNGIEHWARRGIVGRFVLIDIARYREEIGSPLRYDQSDAITPEDLDGALTQQQVKVEVGDVLLIRFGWVGWYESTTTETRLALANAGQSLRTPGLIGTEDMAEWLWDHHVSVVACDVPALEVLPSGPWSSDDPASTYDSYLHFRVIPLLGLAVGEMFVLDELAEDCAADSEYYGLFTAAPINKVGGAGSPANALAIK